MTFHTSTPPPSAHALLVAKVGIVLAVITTAIVTMFVVQTQLQRYQIAPEQIPIADLNAWGELD
jgi:hypothetical protein